MYTYPKTRPPPVSQILQWAGDDFNITLSNIRESIEPLHRRCLSISVWFWWFVRHCRFHSDVAQQLQQPLSVHRGKWVAYEILKTAKCDLIDAFCLVDPGDYFALIIMFVQLVQ